MKKFYYVKEGQSIGPVTKEELIGNLKKDTLIWFEGMNNWIKASEVSELASLFQSVPPPIPTKENELVSRVEVTIKKEKLVTPEHQIAFANEVKNVFIFVVIGAFVALMGYAFRSQNENSEYNALMNEYTNYSKDVEDFYRFKSSYNDEFVANWPKESLERRNNLLAECERLNIYILRNRDGYPLLEPTILNVEDRIRRGNKVSLEFALKIFFISVLVLVIARSLIKSVKWVNSKTAKPS